MNWDDEALKRLQKAPFFVRAMIKKKVEAYVSAAGRELVTSADVSSIKNKHQEDCQGGGDCSNCKLAEKHAKPEE